MIDEARSAESQVLGQRSTQRESYPLAPVNVLLTDVAAWDSAIQRLTAQIETLERALSDPSAHAQPLPRLQRPESEAANAAHQANASEVIAPAASVEELLSHFDTRFVACAYLTLLKRPVDAEGLASYTQHLRAGMARSELVAALVRSAEGRAVRADLPGLAQLLATTEEPPPTRGQRVVQRLAAKALQPLQRQLNRVENQLGRSQLESEKLQFQLESQLAHVLRRIDQIQRALAEAAACMVAPAPLPSSTDMTKTETALHQVVLDGAAIERVRCLLTGERKPGCES